MDWTPEVRSVLSRYQADPDEQVVLELAQHAAAAFEAERADGRSAKEASVRIRQQVDAWCRDVASYPRRRSRVPAVTPPPISASRLAGWVHDLRYGLRRLRRDRAFTVAAIVTTALGIGAVGTLFSVAYGVLLRPLPWPEPDRLVRLWETREGATRSFPRILTNRTYHAWAERPETISGLGAWTGVQTVTFGDDVQGGARIAAVAVSSTVAGAVNVAPFDGPVSVTVGGAFAVPALVPNTSSSVIRLQVFSAPCTRIRTRSVARGENVTLRHTRVLPLIDPPGTVCHAEPVQYCTSKAVNPYCVNVIDGVGSNGAW